MFFEGIGNLEYHNFFTTPYGDPIEEAVFGDLTVFIENHFNTKVKKIALIDSRRGYHNKRIEVFMYHYKDYLYITDGGRFTGEFTRNNSVTILNAAKDIISYYKAEEIFSSLNVVTFDCFESEEISHIKKTIYLSQIEDIKKLLIDDNIVRVYAPIPYALLILFLRNNNYAAKFKASEKCLQFHEMLFKYAKPLDIFGFINDVGDIKEGWWYYYDNEANYAPHKNTFTSYNPFL